MSTAEATSTRSITTTPIPTHVPYRRLPWGTSVSIPSSGASFGTTKSPILCPIDGRNGSPRTPGIRCLTASPTHPLRLLRVRASDEGTAAGGAFAAPRFVVGIVDMQDETVELEAAFELNAEQAARAANQVDNEATRMLRTT